MKNRKSLCVEASNFWSVNEWHKEFRKIWKKWDLCEIDMLDCIKNVQNNSQ